MRLNDCSVTYQSQAPGVLAAQRSGDCTLPGGLTEASEDALGQDAWDFTRETGRARERQERCV